MAFSAATALSHSSFSCISSFPQTLTRRTHSRFSSIPLIKCAAEPEKDKATTTTTETKKAEGSTNAQPQSTAANPPPKKPVYSMKKGQIVRVDKEKYLNSINYLSVGHPPYYKGLDYIYEDRGEVAWVGIPTAPAWLPTDMLIKSDKLNYEKLLTGFEGGIILHFQ